MAGEVSLVGARYGARAAAAAAAEATVLYLIHLTVPQLSETIK